MFDVDFNIGVELWLPPAKRMVKRIAWLKALVKPVINLYSDFMVYQSATIYSLSFTSQTIYLEKLLNDTFNASLTGIYIIDGIVINKTYLFHKNEGGPRQYLFHKSEHQSPIYLFHKSEFNVTVDFIIMVPATVYSQLQNNNNQGLNSMTALVNKYKLAGKRFTINSY